MDTSPFQVRLLTEQTVDETASQPFDARPYHYLTAWLVGTGTTSSGVVTFEQALYQPREEKVYSGTWSSIAAVNASDVTGGATKAVQFTVASYGFVRARISTAIGGGGTMTVDLSGH